jgi:hypothetical protein
VATVDRLLPLGDVARELHGAADRPRVRGVPADGVDFGEACGRLYLAALYVPGVALSARIAS